MVVEFRRYEKDRVQTLDHDHTVGTKKLTGDKRDRAVKEIQAKKTQVSAAGTWLSQILEENPKERETVRNRLEK